MTAEDHDRHHWITEIGCLACRLRFPNLEQSPMSEMHHLTIGGKHGQKRRGHECTIGLCDWHHRGSATEKTKRMRNWLGPSYAKEPTAFRETFGDDDFLLEFQNKAIEIAKEAASIKPRSMQL